MFTEPVLSVTCCFIASLVLSCAQIGILGLGSGVWKGNEVGVGSVGEGQKQIACLGDEKSQGETCWQEEVLGEMRYLNLNYSHLHLELQFDLISSEPLMIDLNQG